MKNKFERLSKEEQKQAIEEYKNLAINNTIVVKKLKNLKIIGIVGIVYALLSFLIDILRNATVFNYIIDAIVLIVCTIFIIKSKSLLSEYVNNYLIKKKK